MSYTLHDSLEKLSNDVSNLKPDSVYYTIQLNDISADYDIAKQLLSDFTVELSKNHFEYDSSSILLFDYIIYNNIFKGFRMRRKSNYGYISTSTYLPLIDDFYRNLISHKFIKSIKKSKKFHLIVENEANAMSASWRTKHFDSRNSTDPNAPMAGSQMNWGLDRINQLKLPLDGAYNPTYHGLNANIFVVDTGIDTGHIEFLNNPLRTVRNVYNAIDEYNSDGSSVVDDVGHGTHCAGIIGGATVGVSKNTNVYGVKVLDSSGQGDDMQVVSGLNYVYEWFLKNGRPPTAISMSLGGACGSTIECEEDVIVQMVEKLSESGITVIVAAGNSDCDACLETPAFAPSSITVGASSADDIGAVFSDYGRCIDIFAPGVEITSACASSICGNLVSFVPMSGTSMACPFVAGVVAQLLEISPHSTPSEIARMLTCIASPMVLKINQEIDSIVETRNLLLQIPSSNEESVLLCESGAGCENLCSGHGYCQHEETSLTMGARDTYCLCDSGYWGEECQSIEYGSHCSEGYVFLPYTLYNMNQGSSTRVTNRFLEPTWNGVSYRISRSIGSGNPSDSEFQYYYPIEVTSMCGGFVETSGVCVKPNDVYKFEVTLPPVAPLVSEHPDDAISNERQIANQLALAQPIGWEVCGVTGGAPITHQYFMPKSDGSCEIQCAVPLITLNMVDTHGDGWNGGYYRVYDRVTGVTYGAGTMLEGHQTQSHQICLLPSDGLGSPLNVSSWVLHGALETSGGHRDFESSWSFCGEDKTLGTDLLLFDYSVADTGEYSLRGDISAGMCTVLKKPLHVKSVIENPTSDANGMCVVDRYTYLPYSLGFVWSTMHALNEDTDGAVTLQIGVSNITSAEKYSRVEVMFENQLGMSANNTPASSVVQMESVCVPDNAWDISSHASGLGDSASMVQDSYGILCNSRVYHSYVPSNMQNGSVSRTPDMHSRYSHIPLSQHVHPTNNHTYHVNEAIPSGCIRDCISIRSTAYDYPQYLSDAYRACSLENGCTHHRKDHVDLFDLQAQYVLHNPEEILASMFVMRPKNMSTNSETAPYGFDLDIYTEIDSLHKDLCYIAPINSSTPNSQKEECYRLAVGAGNYLKTPVAWSICGVDALPTAFVLDVCINRANQCRIINFDDTSIRMQSSLDVISNNIVTRVPMQSDPCVNISNSAPMSVLLAGSVDRILPGHSGWMDAKYSIYSLEVLTWFGKANTHHQEGNVTGVDSLGNPVTLVKEGTLSIGSAGADSMCLQPGCYIGGINPSVAYPSINNGLMWVVCGHLATAASPIFFEITAEGTCVVVADPVICQSRELLHEMHIAAVIATAVTIFCVGLLLFRQLYRLCCVAGMSSMDKTPLIPSTELYQRVPSESSIHENDLQEADLGMSDRQDSASLEMTVMRSSV